MKQVKKSWIAVLLGALLMGVLVGAVWARPGGRPRAAATTKKMTIPAGAFHPVDEGYEFYNDGSWITADTAGANFATHVVFPGGGDRFTVEKLTLYAYDKAMPANICVYLYRTNPTNGTESLMASKCSSGSSSTDPRSFTTTNINPSLATTPRGLYVLLEIEDATNLDAYGVRIYYRKGT